MVKNRPRAVRGGFFLLFQLGFIRKILFRELRHDAGEGEEGDEVRDGHEAVEGIGDVPHHVERGDRADDNDDDEQDLIALRDLEAEQILHAAAAVERPAEDRGKCEKRQRQRDEHRGELDAEHGGERARDELGADLLAEGDVDAAADDGHGRQRADDDGVGEDLKDAVQALLDGALGIGRRVRDGRGAEARLIGEGASAQAPDDGLLERNAAGRAAEGLGREGCAEDLGEGRADVAGVAEDDDEGEDDIENAHDRDELFGHRADALDAAEEDHADQARDHKAENEVQQLPLPFCRGDEGVDGVVERADDGVDLRHVADAEGGDGREHAEQHADPLPVLAEAVFNVIHRAADPVALGVTFPVLDGERDLGILDDHAEQRREPQPEHCAVAAEGDGLRGADDVASADRRGQRRGNGLQWGDGARAGLLLLEHLADRVLHRVAKARELDPTVADRQVQTADDRTWQENIQPGDGIQCTGKEIDDSFHMFSFPDAPRPSFSFS